MAKTKVLIVEDDAVLQNLLAEVLTPEFDLVLASNSDEGYRLAVSQNPDIALLDVRMPGGSGMDLCKILRAEPATSRIKVIMLTGQIDLETITTAFDMGADDYLCKPFRMQELVARIRSKARRIQERTIAVQEYGNLRVVPEQLLVRLNGEETRLSPLEFALLEFFLANGEKIASRKQILRKVWSGSVVSDRTVDAHIVSLRKKLSGFDYEIVTIYGAGYALKRRTGAAAAHVAQADASVRL